MRDNHIAYIKKYFPTTSTKDVAKQLNVSINKVQYIAKHHHIKKCPKYLNQLKKQLIINRRNWYEDSIPNLTPTHYQEQLLFGSILGDGYLSKGAKRSINYYYQEHFSPNQRKYREWKLSQLQNCHFNLKGNYLRSISHPYFNHLHAFFYPNNIKSINKDILSKYTHPVFLASLYLDDGSLIISYSFNKKSNILYCHPSIILYTLNFTYNENKLLADHLNKVFQTNFVVSSHPDRHKSLLKLNKESAVSHLLKTINPIVKNIPSMQYKTDISENIRLKRKYIFEKYGENIKIKISRSERRNEYKREELDKIIQWKNDGYTDKYIANQLNRTYWSVVYKISELRKQGFSL